MAYTKTHWINGQAPALSAENLNKIEEGIYNADADITALSAELKKDYIIETGTDNGWEYRKWASGLYDARQAVAHNVAVNTAWGVLYTSSTVQVNLPSFQIAGTTAEYSVVGSTNGGEILRMVTLRFDGDYIAFAVALPASRAAAARTASLILQGRWK